MVYIPDIVNYQPFYIQTDADSAAIDIKSQWGIIVMTNPDIVLPKAKEPYKNEWLDENGDDEYNAQMFYEAMEINVSIYVSADTPAEVRQIKDRFFEKIQQGEFKIFFSAMQRGYRKVRYVSETIDRKILSKRHTEISTLTFKVNDPITHVNLIGNKLVEA